MSNSDYATKSFDAALKRTYDLLGGRALSNLPTEKILELFSNNFNEAQVIELQKDDPLSRMALPYLSLSGIGRHNLENFPFLKNVATFFGAKIDGNTIFYDRADVGFVMIRPHYLGDEPVPKLHLAFYPSIVAPFKGFDKLKTYLTTLGDRIADGEDRHAAFRELAEEDVEMASSLSEYGSIRFPNVRGRHRPHGPAFTSMNGKTISLADNTRFDVPHIISSANLPIETERENEAVLGDGTLDDFLKHMRVYVSFERLVK